MYWVHNVFPLVKQRFPRLIFKDVNLIIANKWRSLSTEEQKVYIDSGKNI